MIFSQASQGIEPFQVMVLLKRAQALAAAGRDIVHMEAGEPDFSTPEPIANAAKQAIDAGLTSYTPALGLDVLKAKISDYYQSHYGVTVEPNRIAITAGATAGLQLALAAIVNPGDEILIPDPGYPCNRHLVTLAGGKPVLLPTDSDSGFKPEPAQIETVWNTQSRALMLATPANPTGATLSAEELGALVEQAKALGGLAIVDEIYHGLTYGFDAPTVLASHPEAIVLNSFSKYFGMTGWRLGWMVVPEAMTPTLERLAQNLFLAPSTIAQHAAMAAFEPETIAICEQRRLAFQARRDFLLPALRDIGFEIPVTADGAFYLYADASKFTSDSLSFCLQTLEGIGVAMTPGVDFGSLRSNCHVRFTYTTTMERLKEGVKRLRQYLA